MTPRIYVACLASYNNGTLFGDWIDADQDESAIGADIADLLLRSPHPNVMVDCANIRCDAGQVDGADCPTCKGKGSVPSAEEWSIHDYDEMTDLGENPNLDDVSLHARMLVKYDAAWSAYSDLVGACHATQDGFQDSYSGEYESAESYAEELLDATGSLGDMPENLREYFDYERFARDLGYDGYNFIRSARSTVFVFTDQ